MSNSNGGEGLIKTIIGIALGFGIAYACQNYRVVKVGSNQPAITQPSNPHQFNQASSLNRGSYNRTGR